MGRGNKKEKKGLFLQLKQEASTDNYDKSTNFLRVPQIYFLRKLFVHGDINVKPH